MAYGHKLRKELAMAIDPAEMDFRTVTEPGGNFVAGFNTEAEANYDAMDRNNRAVGLGISTRYRPNN